MIIIYTHDLSFSAHDEFFGVKTQVLFIYIPYGGYSDIFLKAGS